MNKILLILVALLILPVVTAFNLTTFSDGSSDQNLTVNGSVNHTFFLNIGENAQHINFSINMTGYPEDSNSTYGDIVWQDGDNSSWYGIGNTNAEVVSCGADCPSGVSYWAHVENGLNLAQYNLTDNYTSIAGENANISFIVKTDGTNGQVICFNEVARTSTPPFCQGIGGLQWISVGSYWQSVPSIGILSNNPLEKFTFLVNFTNETVEVFVNETYSGTFSFFTGGTTKVNFVALAPQLNDIYLSNLSFVTNISNVKYPNNVSIFWDSILGFNYGDLNLSPLDHKVEAIFAGTSTYSPPSEINFIANGSGYMSIEDLFINYNNMLNITIYNEDTGAKITDNMTVELTQGTEIQTKYTVSGNLKMYNDFDGDYTVGVFGTNYAKRRYAISISSTNSLDLAVYMANRSLTTTFNVQNKITGDPLENALMTQYRLINDEWNLINSLFTDINGQAEFSYAEGVRYQFNVIADDYQNKTFYLDPITSDEYNVLMIPVGADGSENDYFGVMLDLDPRVFIDDTQNNLTVRILSPGNILQSYNLTLTYPTSGSKFVSGSSTNGENFYIPFNITNAAINDTVRVVFAYTDIYGSDRTYTYLYLINDNGSSMRGTHGLGLLARIFIMIFISMIVGGAVMSFSGMEAGVWTALLIQGIMAYLLMINILFIFPSIFAALLLLSKRTQ